MKKSVTLFALVWLTSVAGYVAGVYGLCRLAEHWPWVGSFVFVDTHGSAAFSLKGALVQPTAFAAVMACCLALEAVVLGIDRSSIRRLVNADSASTRVDLFYVALKLTGGVNLLAFVLSFGTLFWVVNQVHRYLSIGVLQYVDSFVLQFALVYAINTLIAYWGHRLMHTKLLWEIHKVHHAAEEMNVVTSVRNHPVDHVINSLLNALPVALLGADRAVILTYYAFNMAYQLLVHSEIDLKGRWWDRIWITPSAHRIHHSSRPEHWDTNFGVVTFWDKLFGTYYGPGKNEQLTYGVDGGEDFNRPQVVREVFANVKRWVTRTGSENTQVPLPLRPQRMTPPQETPLRKSA